MREGWTYKKLGDTCDLMAGGDVPKSRFSKEKNDIYNVPIYSNGVVNEGLYGYTDIPKITKNSITISGRGTIGFVAKRTEPFYPAIRLIVATPREGIDVSYLCYCVISKHFDGNGVAIPQLTVPMIKNVIIPIPPLAEQERIVAELDLISSIIDKKKAQLKEYDQLAQSIFYDMFGDPITNEKGWETKKLVEVSTLLNGRAYKQNELLDEGKYKVLRVGNFFTNSSFYYSNLELEDNKYCDNGDLLFAWSASFGAFIWSGDKVIYHYHIWKVLFDENRLNKVFYQYLLNLMTNSFMKDLHGIGMMHLTKVGMEQYILPLPPLSLQQEFADKIEAIERQKALIQQSIAETETLFNSRMDYYFN